MFRTQKAFENFVKKSIATCKSNERIQNVVTPFVEYYEKITSIVKELNTDYEKSKSVDEWHFIPFKSSDLNKIIAIIIMFQRKGLNVNNYNKVNSFYDLGSGFNLLVNFIDSVLYSVNKSYFKKSIPRFTNYCLGMDNDSKIVKIMKPSSAYYNFVTGDLLKMQFEASLTYYTYQPFRTPDLMCKFVMRVLKQMPEETIFIVVYACSKSFALVKKELKTSTLKVLVMGEGTLKIYFKQKQPGNAEINQSSTTKKK